MTKKKETKQVRIDAKLHKKLGIKAAKTGRTMGELIEEKFTNDK